MTTYTTISNADLDQDSPGTQPLFTALRDNPLAIGEVASGAPVAQGVWHPYDMVDVGDGADGEIYNHGTDGTVANVETPLFGNGYEYRLLCVELSTSSTAVPLQIELYKETDAAYATASNISASVGGADLVTADVTLLLPRVSRTTFLARSATGVGSAFTATPYLVGFYDATVQKVSKARIAWSAGNIDNGKIYMLRRRETLSG